MLQRSSINLMKCCEMHNQKSHVKKLSLDVNNEIKMTMNNTNKPMKTTLKYKSFGTKITGKSVAG